MKKLQLKNPLLSSTTYGFIACLLILVSLPSFGGSTTAPSNDIYADADDIAGESGSITGNNFDATAEFDDPTEGGKSIWWKWIAPSDGSFAFDTFGSGVEDTVIAVGTGDTIEEFNQIASNDDADGSTTQSRVVFQATQDTVYYIVVDVFFDDVEPLVGGAITLNWAPGPELDLPVMVYNFRQVTKYRGQARDGDGDLVFNDEGDPVWARTQTFTESGLLIRGRKDGASLENDGEVGPAAAVFLSSSREGRVTTRFYEKLVSEDNADGTIRGRVIQYSGRSFEEQIQVELESAENYFFQFNNGAASLRALYRGGLRLHYAPKLKSAFLDFVPYSNATAQGAPLPGERTDYSDTLLYNSSLSARVKDAATFQDAVDAIIEFLESRAGGSHVPVK